jgi:hypothetical protein
MAISGRDAALDELDTRSDLRRALVLLAVCSPLQEHAAYIREQVSTTKQIEAGSAMDVSKTDTLTLSAPGRGPKCDNTRTGSGG